MDDGPAWIGGEKGPAAIHRWPVWPEGWPFGRLAWCRRPMARKPTGSSMAVNNLSMLGRVWRMVSSTMVRVMLTRPSI